MKQIHLLLVYAFTAVFLLWFSDGKSQTTIHFDTPENWIQDEGVSSLASYGSHAYQESGVVIQGTNVLRNTTTVQDGFSGAIGTYSIRIRNATDAKALITVASGGISTFSFKVRRWDSSPIPVYSVKYSLDGGSNWVDLTSINGDLLTSSDWFTYNGTINSTNDNIQIEIANTGTTERIMIEDFMWTEFSGAGNIDPVITNIIQTPMLVQSQNSVGVDAEVTDSDGTIELVELHWGTSASALDNTILMTSWGGDIYTTMTTIPEQVNGATVYYEIYVEDNDGGTTTSSIQSYLVVPYTYEELFTTDLGECYTYSVSGDTKYWNHNSSLGNAQMNGHDSGELEEDWLILPTMNLTGEDLLLSFDSWRRYGVDDAVNYLKLYYSVDYPGSGDPTNYTWQELQFIEPTEEQVWTSSGKMELSTIVGNAVYFGFKYHYNSGSYTQWYIDNIRIEKRTYSVTFDLTDGTNPIGTDPIVGATIDFYSSEMISDASGEAVRLWIEPENDLIYTITKEGYHDYIDTLDVVDKDLIKEVKMLDTSVAIDVVANPDDGFATISWTGLGADSYRILYYETGTTANQFLSASSSPASIPVQPTTTYTVRVKTLVNGVWSLYSDPVEFTSLAGTQQIADNITISNIGSNTADVNWDGSGADSYRILYYETGTTDNQFLSASSSPASIPVQPATTYTLRVKSLVNGVWSSYSDAVEFTSLAGVQQIADNITITNIGSNTADVNWDGSGADSYRILYYETGTTANQFLSANSSPASIPVQPSTTYTVRIKTLVSGVWSSYSDAVEFTSLAGAQQIADNITISNIGSNTADVNWDGSGAEIYRILYYETGTTNNQFLSSSSSPTTISVQPSTTYTVRVKSMINSVWSSYSDPVEFTSAATPPLAPSMVSSSSNNFVSKEVFGVIYPNPVIDYIHVPVMLDLAENIKVSIIDLNGRILKIHERSVINQTESFDVSNLESGIYFIKIDSKSYSETQRFIKQ